MEYWKAAGNNAAFHWEGSMGSIASLLFVELLGCLQWPASHSLCLTTQTAITERQRKRWSWEVSELAFY